MRRKILRSALAGALAVGGVVLSSPATVGAVGPPETSPTMCTATPGKPCVVTATSGTVGYVAAATAWRIFRSDFLCEEQGTVEASSGQSSLPVGTVGEGESTESVPYCAEILEGGEGAVTLAA